MKVWTVEGEKQIIHNPATTPLGFCEYYCGKLEPVQKTMTEKAFKGGRFLGVGRPTGSMRFCPLIASGDGKNAYVIDGAGYTQLPSLEGRIGYTT